MPEIEKESLAGINARVEQAREELARALEQLRKAARGATTRLSERGTALFEELVKSGEALQQQRQKAGAQSKDSVEGTLGALRQRTVELLGVPTQEDLATLNRKLDSLTRKVRKIEKAASA